MNKNEACMIHMSVYKTTLLEQLVEMGRDGPFRSVQIRLVSLPSHASYDLLMTQRISEGT